MSKTALTGPERRKMNDLESIIEAGLKTFVEVGAALSIIREQRLYRETHSSFDAYCEERWGWTRQRAAQLIDASDVVQELSTMVDTLPASERQARELVAVPEEKRAEVWQEATKAAEAEGKKPTAEHVKKAGEPFRPKMPAPPKAKPQSRVDALREQREREYEERQANPPVEKEGPAEPNPRSGEKAPATGGAPTPAQPTIARDGLIAALATVPAVGSDDARLIADTLTEVEIQHVRRVRETCQRIMTEYAKKGVAAA